MTTYSALTTMQGEAPAYALADDLEALVPEPTGIGVFEVEDGSGLWEVGAYFTERPDVAALAVMSALHGARPFAVSQIPDQDWVSKVQRELAPVVAGRFFVHGAHDADKVPPDAIPLRIEAQMAFGTGHHGTTLGCLQALNGLVAGGFAGQRVADIGCGTAVLAMAAAHLLDGPVLASDIDPVAVEVAQANVTANGLDRRVDCFVAAGLDGPGFAPHSPFDLIFANILKGPLAALAPAISAHCADDGYVILSGILNEQATEMTQIYQRNGFNLINSESIVEWTTLLMRKNPPTM